MSNANEDTKKPMPEGLTSRFFNGEEYLNISQAGRYVRYSSTGFREMLDEYRRQKEKDPTFESPLPIWIFGPEPIPGKKDSRTKYIKRSDLDKWAAPHRVE